MKHALGPWMTRIVAYVALTAGAALTPWLDLGRELDGQLFTEHTILEGMELVAIALPAIILAVVAAVSPPNRSLSLVLALLLLAAIVRELDYYFDHNFFDGAWQLLVTAILIVIGGLLWRDWKRFKAGLVAISGTPAMGFMAAGTLTTAVFSRLFGMREFWQAVMEERYDRSIKNAVEETVELFGYTLILIGVIEFCLWLRKGARSTASRAAGVESVENHSPRRPDEQDRHGTRETQTGSR